MVERVRVEASVDPRHLADWLLSHGRHAVTTAEAAELLGIPGAHVAPTLARHLAHGLLFSPTKGLYVPIPPRLRSRSFGRVRVEFINSARTPDRAIQRLNTPTGTVAVSTIETTILDMLSHPNLSGSLFNVATIIGDMIQEERVNPANLADGSAGYPRSVAQRTGWMLDYMAERVGTAIDTAPLHSALGSRVSPTLLDAAAPRAGLRNDRWNVIVNEHPDEESS